MHCTRSTPLLVISDHTCTHIHTTHTHSQLIRPVSCTGHLLQLSLYKKGICQFPASMKHVSQTTQHRRARGRPPIGPGLAGFDHMFLVLTTLPCAHLNEALDMEGLDGGRPLPGLVGPDHVSLLLKFNRLLEAQLPHPAVLYISARAQLGQCLHIGCSALARAHATPTYAHARTRTHPTAHTAQHTAHICNAYRCAGTWAPTVLYTGAQVRRSWHMTYGT